MFRPRNFVVWTVLGTLLSLILPVVGTAIAGLMFPDFRLTHLPLHSLIEGAGGLIALAIAGILLAEMSRKSDASHYPWMAAGFTSMGVLDLFHAAASPGNEFIWLRGVATFFGSVFFGLVWLSAWKPQRPLRPMFPLMVALLTIAFGAVSLLASGYVPAMRTPDGAFSTTAVTMNISSGIGFLAAAAFFGRRCLTIGDAEDWLFAMQATLFGAAGLVLSYSVVWDGGWWWSHLLRLAAYVIALTYGLRTFRDAERELRQTNQQLRQANDTLDRDRTLLEAIHSAQTQFITAESPLAVFDAFLKYILALSESEYGFIDEMFYNPEGQPILTARAITDISWNDESRRMYQQFTDGTLNFTNLKSLFGVVMTTGKPVIANDAPNDPRRTGIPPGHPPLKAFLGLPMLSSSQEFVGVIGLANRPGGYSEEFITYLQPMVSACANLIAARKNDQRRKQAEQDLRQTLDELDLRVRERTTELQNANEALHTEVTVRQQAEQALRDSEERSNLALKSSGVGTWSWDVVQNSIFWDDFIHPLFGLEPGTFPGSYEDFLRMLHSDDRDRVTQEVTRSVEDDAPYDTEYKVVWPNGSLHVLGSRAKVYRDAGGRPLRMTGVCWDITERKRLEDRYRLAVEASPAALLMVNQDGRILMANSRGLTLFGYTEAELIGQPIELLVPQRFRAGLPAHRDSFFNDPVQRPMGAELDLLGVRKDGTEFPVKVGLSPVETAKGQAVICGVIDITDQIKMMEAMRQAKEAAESASRAKSSFLANMSHEIRTPMNGIIGMAQLLAQTELRSHQRDYLATVDESAHILLRLLNDILDFSKIEAGKLELECVDFRISECVARATQMMVLRAAEKGLEIACRVAPEIPDHLRGDSGRIQQVLVNLLGNAVKFTEAGEIFVNVNAESITPDRIRLHISVSDTGIGIPADKLDQIFRPFEQAESSTTRRFGGTGLGLAISQQLVEMMHGRIWIDSEYGRGSTFHFTAEFGIAADQHRPAPAELDSLLELPVLVVDDNFTNRRILSEMLQHWHMQPVLADSAAAARQALQKAEAAQHPIRLILLDHNMPGEDGIHFAESLRGSHGQCPIIMISSGSSPIDVDLGQKYGIGRFMTKPVIASELLNEVLHQFRRFTNAATAQPPTATPHVQVQPRRVLLVEDNEINRRVAVGLLRSRGHHVVLVENGQEAVNTLAEQEFDVVLMDMQMPVMDGYEATAEIRKREHQTGGHIPIVAMTAEALKGDRERCLTAGMDDYVSKPIDPAEMYRAIERFPAVCLPADAGLRECESPAEPLAAEQHGSAGASPSQNVTLQAAGGELPAVDWNVAKHRLGSGSEVLSEFSELVKAQAPTLLADLRRAIETRDIKLLRLSAHTLKGSASYFGAEPLVQAALALEVLGRTESFDNSTELLATLEHEVTRVLAALEIGPPILTS